MKPPSLLVACVLFSACLNNVPAPAALVSQPLGGPCTVNSECASGLTCIGFQNDPRGKAWVGGNVCSTTCDAGVASCPAGSTCIDGSSVFAGRAGLVCVPVCTTSADCQLGNRAGACVTLDGGTSICEELTTAYGNSACAAPNCTGDDMCPAGFKSVAPSMSYTYCGK